MTYARTHIPRPRFFIPTAILPLALGACLGAAGSGDGSSTSTSGDSHGSSGSTGTSGVPGCECFTQEPYGIRWTCEPGIECGEYVEHVDGTDGPTDPCDDPTGTTGGESPECEQEMTSNAMVVECVLAAAAAGDAVHFRHLNNPGNIYADYDDYWVRPGEPLGVQREEFRDLCDDFWGELRADPSFDACMGLEPHAAWACIYQQISTEPTADCGRWGGCEGT